MAPSTYIRLAEGALVGTEACLIVWLLATEDVRPIGLLLLGAVVAVAFISLLAKSWPLGAMSLLVISSAIPRVKWTVFGLHVRPEHVAIALVVLVVLLQVARGQFKALPALRTFDYSLFAYILLNFFSSAIASPEPRMTLRWATLNAIVVVPYFLMRLLIKSEGVLYKALHVLLWVGAAEAVYGIVCFLSNHISGTAFGMELDQYGFLPATYGTQYEANLFGSYTACCAIMFLAFFLIDDTSRRTYYAWGFAVTASGAVISLARSVLVAFPFAAFVVLWIALRRGHLKRRRLVQLAVGFGLLLCAISPLLGLVRERFSTIDAREVSADPTTWERLAILTAAIEDVKAHPTFGTGTASFHLSFDPRDYPQGFSGDADDPGWISNTPLRILHDTGIAGLMAILLFLSSLIIALRKVVGPSGGRTVAALAALSGGLVLYAITFQASEATMLAFTWIHVGLLAAGVTILQHKTLGLDVDRGR
jgi:O-antigen ligase